MERLKAETCTPGKARVSMAWAVNTGYLRVKFRTDGSKIAESEVGHDRVVTCDFSYSLDGKRFKKLGNPFQAKEGRWIGAKVGMFCTRPAIKINDGGWADVDWFRITK